MQFSCYILHSIKICFYCDLFLGVKTKRKNENRNENFVEQARLQLEDIAMYFSDKPHLGDAEHFIFPHKYSSPFSLKRKFCNWCYCVKICFNAPESASFRCMQMQLTTSHVTYCWLWSRTNRQVFFFVERGILVFPLDWYHWKLRENRHSSVHEAALNSIVKL